MRRILVGYEGSEAAGHALDQACELAKLYNCPLTVLTAAADRLVDDQGALIPASCDEGGQIIATEGVLRAQQRGVFWVEARTSVEAPDDALVLMAGEGFDLVVVGHRSRSAIRGLFLGSTAKAVLDRVRCSVLVVRQRRDL